MDGWEDQIDVDDSDLLSLIPLSNPNPSPLLRPCSQPIRPCSQSIRPCSQATPLPPPKQPQSSPPLPPNSAPPRRLIPGPAGSVQAAMHRQAFAARPRSGSQAQEKRGDGWTLGVGDEDDMDFKLNPWHCALDCIGDGGNSTLPCPISSIRTNRDNHRVEQVVGVVSSCRPNGLGGLFLTLKDPTGTIGAFIHNKVLAESSFGRAELAVGCVLILKQVAVFHVRAMSYLNVTLTNMEKLIGKDSGPPQRSIPTTPFSIGKNSEVGFGIASRSEGAERIVSGDLCREDMAVELEAAKQTPLRRAVADQIAEVDAIRNVKHKRMPVDNNALGENGSTPLCISTPAATSCAQLKENMRVPLAVEAAQNPYNEVITGASSRTSNPDQMEEDLAGRLAPSVGASAVTTCGLVASTSLTRQGSGEGHVDEVMEITNRMIRSNKSTEGPITSLACNTTDTTTASLVTVKPDVKSSEPKRLISEASVTEWTDDQLKELFSDYQDVDMDMFAF